MKNLLFKPIKLPSDNVLFWSDLHLGHNKEFLWGKRGFKDVESHDKAIINAWNSKANSDTIGVLLGDTMFGPGGCERLISLLNKMTCKKWYLMPGNHYAGFKQLIAKCHIDCLDPNTDTFYNFLPNYVEFYVKKQPIVCSHYPIVSWNGMGKGSWMLYGHVHGSLNKSEVGGKYTSSGAKSLELCPEVCPYPLKFQEIKEIMDKKYTIS